MMDLAMNFDRVDRHLCTGVYAGCKSGSSGNADG